MITTVLFDLDGTLLPMDQDTFVGFYFKRLAAKVAPRGYEPKALIEGIWKGTKAMVMNDGSVSNEKAFWRCFAGIFGERVYGDIDAFEAFYANEFNEAQAVCGYTPKADAVVKQCKAQGLRVALATNPLFPAVATDNRIRWAGLDKADFELVTTYENCSTCKPNPAYFTQVAKTLGVKPEECLMVGNDLTDDGAAVRAGMTLFVLTDCLIAKEDADLAAYAHGDFDALAAYLAEIR